MRCGSCRQGCGLYPDDRCMAMSQKPSEWAGGWGPSGQHERQSRRVEAGSWAIWHLQRTVHQAIQQGRAVQQGYLGTVDGTGINKCMSPTQGLGPGSQKHSES